MSDNTPRRPESKGWLSAPAVTVLLAAILVGGLWMVNRALTATPDATAQQTPNGTAEAWPTIPATFTPMPTATAAATLTPVATITAVPTATPIVLDLKQMSDLVVVEFTLSTVTKEKAESQGLRDLLNGSDEVVIQAVGKVPIAVDMSKAEANRNYTMIVITLPKPTVRDAVLLPDQSPILSSEQRIFFSAYAGLETKAFAKAKSDLEAFVRNNASLMSAAEEMAELRIEAHLRNLGFTDITINFI